MEYYEELQCFVRRQNKNAKHSGIFKRVFLRNKILAGFNSFKRFYGFYKTMKSSVYSLINIFILIHLKLVFVLSKFRVQKLIGTEMESWTILI